MLQIITLEVTPFAQNARLLWDAEKKSLWIVDPGGEIDRIMAVVERLGPKEADVLLTHAHLDHAGGVANCLNRLLEFVERPPALHAHREPLLRGLVQAQAKNYGLSLHEFQNVPEPQVLWDGDERFTVGASTAKVLFTPGHAPDHVAIYVEHVEAELLDLTTPVGQPASRISGPLVIAGDALFAGSIGRTDLPGGSLPTLLQSIRTKLLTLPDHTRVLCGHGPDTTIGEERRTNPFLATE